MDSRWNRTDATMMIGSTSSDERELPADDEQHDEREHQQQAAADELQQAPLDQLGHALDVGGHPRHEHAGLVAIEEGHRLARRRSNTRTRRSRRKPSPAWLTP